jgi:hypothetical protein
MRLDLKIYFCGEFNNSKISYMLNKKEIVAMLGRAYIRLLIL